MALAIGDGALLEGLDDVEQVAESPLSLRMVEDLLAVRGIIVSHETVRCWAEKFGRI